ncbi:hypothetical protein [Streptomyces flaveolus]|uniref:hypothetical protein n=1 Tax=Streptomyces flaveolus TaxID=67297 RepID=UPI003323B1FA
MFSLADIQAEVDIGLALVVHKRSPVEDASGDPEASPSPFTTEPPPGAPFTLDVLEALTSDTAQRARGLAAGRTASLTGTLSRTPYASPRAASTRTGSTGSSVPRACLRSTSPAWSAPRRHGGPAGVAVARAPLTPDPAAMAAARTALLDPDNADGVDAAARTVRLRAWRNRLTADNEGIQIRLGPDNRWHLYIREGHGTAAAWWTCAPPSPTPSPPHRRHAELTD